MFRKLKLIIKYIGDKEVPIIKKILIIGSLLYLVMPMDIVPDYIIGLGWLDDAAVLLFIWNAVKSEIEQYGKVITPRKKLKGKVIDFNKRGKKTENDK